MLHKVVLPGSTKTHLCEVIAWQFRLLECALDASNLSESDVQTWLVSHVKASVDQAENIVAWLCRRRGTNPGRLGKLQLFRNEQPEAHDEKKQWLTARKREADALLNGDPAQLEPLLYDKSAPVWRKAAAEFLERFYDDLTYGLPACLFTDLGEDAYTRDSFLKTFFSTNPGLCICPICDMTPLRTVVRGSFYVDVDHFFPKSVYPHLSVHPYNLVPICHVCNSGAKKAVDPLASPTGPRYRTSDIRLPYRSSTSLSEELLISLPTAGQPFALRTFALRAGVTSEQSIEAINDVLQRVFDIPQRWDKGIGTIGEIMFRRVREHLWFLETEPTSDQAQTYLDELLAMVEQHSSAKEPYSIAMIWWLVYLSNSDLSHADSPFLQEIKSWQEERRDQLLTLRERGKTLRAMITQLESDS